MENKKGISPVVATVLLIVIVVVIALIVFLWMKNWQDEAITKFGKNVELVCDDVSFDASYSGGDLQISNTGNVPIINMKAQLSNGDVEDIRDSSNDWPNRGLVAGGGFSDTLEFVSGKIKLIPVLYGASDSGKKEFICDERYGKEIFI